MGTEQRTNKRRRKWLYITLAIVAVAAYMYWTLKVRGWWREEVRLSDNSIVEIRRKFESNTPLFPVDKLLVWDRIQFKSNEEAVPEWRGNYVMALVVDRDIVTREWYVIATLMANYSPLSREQRGYDAPYVEYRLRNGYWNVYTVSEKHWNRRTNILADYPPEVYAGRIVGADQKLAINKKITGDRRFFGIFRDATGSYQSYGDSKDALIDQGATQ